ILLSGATITPNTSITLTVVVTVDLDATSGTIITNTASVTSSKVITPETSPPVTNTVGAPILGISKVNNPTSLVGVGDTITYTIVVSNSGNLTATNVTISDTLANEVGDGTPAVSVEPSGNGSTSLTPPILLSGATITPNTSITLTVVVTVDLDVVSGTIITNTASVTSSKVITPETSPPVTNTVGIPILGITKVNNPTGLVSVGDTITYTIVVSNSGNLTATNVTISDTLPSEVGDSPPTVSVAPSGNGSTSPTPPILLSGATLTPNTSITLTVVVTVNQGLSDGTIITNTASVTSTQIPTPTNSNTVTNTVTRPVLTITKQVDPTGVVSAGDTMTYTIVVFNNGSSDATGVTISDTIPANTSYVTNSLTITPVAAGTVSEPVGGLIFINPVTVSTSSQITITFQVTVVNLIPGGVNVITNTAQLSSTSVITTDSVTNSTTIANPQVIKTVSPTSNAANPLRIGDLITYTLVTIVPAGAYVPWPYQYDYLPIGFRYITDTFAVTTNMTFNGVSLTDTVTSPFVSRRSSDTGVAGTTATVNPNVGMRAGSAFTRNQAIEWWLQPLDNGSSSTTGLVTVTFQVQLLGLDFQGVVTWTDQLTVENGTNRSQFVWNIEDVGSYTTTVSIDSDTSTEPTTHIGQPSLTIDKDSTPISGTYVTSGDTITYTLTITNSGYQAAYDMVITDTLATGLSYQNTISNPAVGVVITTTGPVNQAITYTVSELAAGPNTTMVITMVAQVATPITGGIRLTNTAGIPYYDSQPGSGPGSISPTQQTYSDGTDSVIHQTSVATIGNYVWNDTDNDGIQDGSESGISGITVTLYLGAAAVQTTTTDASGLYTFTNVTSGTYSVLFDPLTYTVTSQNQGSDDNLDSDANGIGRTTNFTVTPGSVITDVDAGLYLPATIGDYVWNDTNNDGIQDSGEPGISGITVTLYLGAAAVQTTTTDASGLYTFTNVTSGT
ncbi:MAG: DUF11 domain-containing protein, partial [Gammaproteobacteria bacterium]|nr:DUF11 domain-containing protein [Gammaproteobacteria bacterium]